MSHWNNGGASRYDPRYNTYATGQFYQESEPDMRPSSGSRTGARNEEVGNAPSGHPLQRSTTAPYVTSQTEQPQMYARSGNVANQTSGVLGGDSTHAYGRDYTAPSQSAPVTSYPPHARGHYLDEIRPDQPASMSQTYTRLNPGSNNGSVGRDSESANITNYDRVPMSRADNAFALAPHLNTQHQSDQPLEIEALGTDSGEQSQHPISTSSEREIAVMLFDDATQKWRFRCNVPGCTEKTCGRPEEQKRHYIEKHIGVVLLCRWCKHSEARKYKLVKHCREAHGLEYVD